jgi:hypothetical protein
MTATVADVALAAPIGLAIGAVLGFIVGARYRIERRDDG